MNDVKIGLVRDNIIGLRPVYTNTGSATEVLLRNGTILLDKRKISTVIKAVARNYALDLTAQRQVVREYLQRKAVLPFYLSTERVFIPLKMRAAVSPNDSTYGFLDIKYISDIVENGKGCRVVLTTGKVIEVLSNKTTVIQNQHLCFKLLERLNCAEENVNNEDQLIIESIWVIINKLRKMSRQLDNIEKKIEE